MVYRERLSDGTTRLTGAGGSGTPGPPGDPGPEGPEGTRWGTTTAWAFADATDVECEMADGGEPRVGDLLISGNGFAQDAVYKITAVYPVTNHVDIEELDPLIRLQGTTGDPGPVPDTGAASSSSVSFSAGSRTFALTAALNKAWPINTTIKIAKFSAPADYMIGYVTASTVDSVTVWVTEVVGAVGTFNSWVLSIGGFRGPQGAAGADGITSPLSAWPIGAVYISVNSTSPATLFGGSWTAMPAGRMLVNRDAGDPNMDVAEETGGEKTVLLTALQSGIRAHVHEGLNVIGTAIRWVANSKAGTTSATISSGAGTEVSVNAAAAAPAAEAHNNMPPYVVVYMWKRTA